MIISEKVIMLKCSVYSHIYLIKGAHTTLIDSGVKGNANKIISELLALNIKSIDRILLTHHDIDHTGNAAKLSSYYHCPVYIGEGDIAYVTGMKKRKGIKGFFAKFLNAKAPGMLEALPDTGFPEIKVFPTPGHTPGHVCYKYGDIFFAGDFFMSSRHILTNMLGLYRPNRKRMDEYRGLNAGHVDFICSSHGRVVKAKDYGL